VKEGTQIGKIKAIEVNVESLKLYLTLSTFLIGGLLAYNSSLKTGFSVSLIISLCLFLITAISSITSLNCYIYKLDRGELNVKVKDARLFNIIAILSFIVGLIFTIIFFFSPNNQIDSSSVNVKQEILIDNNISIIGETKSDIIIEKDSIGNILKVEINNKP
jgi:amino acid transporter